MENTDDVNLQVSLFNENFVSALSECAPFTTKKVKPRISIWITDEIKQLSRAKRNLQREYKMNRSGSTHRKLYNDHEKIIRRKIKQTNKHRHLWDALFPIKLDTKDLKH